MPVLRAAWHRRLLMRAERKRTVLRRLLLSTVCQIVPQRQITVVRRAEQSLRLDRRLSAHAPHCLVERLARKWIAAIIRIARIERKSARSLIRRLIAAIFWVLLIQIAGCTAVNIWFLIGAPGRAALNRRFLLWHAGRAALNRRIIVAFPCRTALRRLVIITLTRRRAVRLCVHAPLPLRTPLR